MIFLNNLLPSKFVWIFLASCAIFLFIIINILHLFAAVISKFWVTQEVKLKVVTISWKVCCATAEKDKFKYEKLFNSLFNTSFKYRKVLYITSDSILEICKSEYAAHVEQVVNLAVLH